MSENVVSITKNAGRKFTQIKLGGLAEELKAELKKPEVCRAQHPSGEERMLEELNALSSEHMVKRLELAHKREAFERALAAEQAALDNELEHAAYFAFMAGVPEDAIYDINDERLSNALTEAISKVQKVQA